MRSAVRICPAAPENTRFRDEAGCFSYFLALFSFSSFLKGWAKDWGRWKTACFRCLSVWVSVWVLNHKKPAPTQNAGAGQGDSVHDPGQKRALNPCRHDSLTKVRISPTSHPNKEHTRPMTSHDTGVLSRSCWIVLSLNSLSLRSRYEEYPASFNAASTSIRYCNGTESPLSLCSIIPHICTETSVQCVQITYTEIRSYCA